MPTRETIALLGTGIMGAAIGRNLLRAGFDVRAWNRTAARAASPSWATRTAWPWICSSMARLSAASGWSSTTSTRF